ncbi:MULTISPECIES: ABC1 kinase family protein [unclassified Rhodococcus (in: high G+C Gram-positive bacteria)]|uniref:ABC1 kinase family protein n=1 Tax=unclassified Rhodococcus (in: high G+C Gram-positive bacteria) TaxID=192944 RepID=UPI000E0C13C6|nr:MULTISPECIES: AarF/ABC1/UbiB kinase family protein [unclassified Rhodococcus (in: high G+C Gram-positive bacteria)]QKT12987.1 AarF/ABC1/UbiB kinase family protein [Rhodococcus sp. W8901]RDI33728.1 ABC1 family protein [Rhodococcus sp. AG1013]
MADKVPTSRLVRGSKLGQVAAGRAIRSAGTRVSMVGRSEEVRARLAEKSAIAAADQLVTVLGSMKGVAMKLGQMLSILDLDLVPEEHREEFQRKLAALRDQAPTTSFETMRDVIEADYGRPLGDVFAEFDPEAVAAASIGQVYRARLHDGRDVAVKVQYPGIDAAIRADMKNLTMFLKIWKSTVPTLSTPALLNELRLNFEGELDYEREALTQRKIAQLYANHPFIAVPDSVPELSTHRVLVSEFFGGTGFAGIRELPQRERNRIGEIIFRFYIGSLYRYHEFCGDPHPGNVLLGDDGRVGFVDFGLFNSMDAEHVEFEKSCLRAATEGRKDDLHALMVQRGVISPAAEVTPDECLDYVYAAAEWNLVDADIAITPEMASTGFLLAIDPRASEFSGMKTQSLPPEHLFSRRADFLTFGVLGQLDASANWHRIGREWVYDDPAATELGAAEEQWRLTL